MMLPFLINLVVNIIKILFVPRARLELAHLSIPDSKSSASTNFTIWGFVVPKGVEPSSLSTTDFKSVAFTNFATGLFSTPGKTRTFNHQILNLAALPISIRELLRLPKGRSLSL